MHVYKPSYTSKTTGKPKRCRRWYISFADSMAVRRRLPAFASKRATDRAAAKLADLLALGGVPDRELQAWLEEIPERMRTRLTRWGVVDGRRVSEHLGKTLTEHVADYRGALEARGRAPAYVRQVAASLERDFGASGFKTWADVDANRFYTYLSGRRGPDGIGQRTFNARLRAAQTFCRWMVKERRATSNPLAHLSPVQQKERRCRRRALTVEEQRRLLRAADKGPDWGGVSGAERALLYRLALETGLRANELRGLTVSAFDFGAAVVTVPASTTKNGTRAEMDLKPDLAEALRRFLAGKAPTDRALTVPHATARMLRADLEAAGIPYRDAAGRAADFHALRHTFISNLARNGVHPSVAQRLARHSTITLTMDHYTHTLRPDLRQVVNELPDLGSDSTNVEETPAARLSYA